MATGNQSLCELIDSGDADIISSFSSKFIPLLRQYYYVGGMSEAVSAFLAGKTWNIPADAHKPLRKNAQDLKSPLLARLEAEKQDKVKGGIYHKVQVELTYNSNHIEGSRLSLDQYYINVLA